MLQAALKKALKKTKAKKAAEAALAAQGEDLGTVGSSEEGHAPMFVEPGPSGAASTRAAEVEEPAEEEDADIAMARSFMQ